MCAKPLVSFYEGLFAFAAAFVAAVALGFTVSYKNSIAAVTHPQRGLILCHHVIRSFESQGAESYNIVLDGEVVGGTVLSIHPETNRNQLQLLFVNVDCHSKGIGFAAWQAIESLHPETEVWETHTPYFDQRNIHFYINKCGFHMVEFFCKYHPEPNEEYSDEDTPGGEGFCRFEKQMR